MSRHVGVVNNSELVFVTVHHLPMMESLVLDPMRKTVHVMTSPAQVKLVSPYLVSSVELSEDLKVGGVNETFVT